MAGANEISTWALIANGRNVYTAFHEIAQLNVAKQLYARGYIPTLELRIEGVGEADIAAAGMLWEVKPLGTPGAKQLSKYTSASGMLTGEPIVPISDIPVVGNIRMGIMSNPSEPGVINYYFYRRNRQNQEERVKSSEVAQQVKSSLVLASATVALIMGVSLVENLAPVVGGVANDIASFVAALTIGSKCFGY